MKNKTNFFDAACEILKSNPQEGDFRENAMKIADDLKRKQIRLLNDITNKRMGGTRKTWAEQRHANW